VKDKKLQVFVSSTYLDLKEERQAAVEAILKAGHIPAGMELFTAGDKSQWEVIKRWIDESDVYMLLLGSRYGSVSPDTGKSYTHMEFDYAIEQGKSRFSLILDDAFLRKKAKREPDFVETENAAKLKDFKAIVKSSLIEFCEDMKDIKLSVINKLGDLSHDKSLVGWVRGDQALNTVQFATELTRLSEENARLREASTNNANVLYNGLPYEELARMLQVVEVKEIVGVKNLHGLFIKIGPRKKRAIEISFYKPEISDILNIYLQYLEDCNMLNITQEERIKYFKATEDGHKFFMKSLSVGDYEVQ